jgi:hypothetical protein
MLLGAIGVSLVLVVVWLSVRASRQSRLDRGSVSERWLADQRNSSTSDDVNG